MFFVLLGFIACLIIGWVVGICDKDDKTTKIIAIITAILILFLSIFTVIAYKKVIIENIVLEQYGIKKHINTDTTYYIINYENS